MALRQGLRSVSRAVAPAFPRNKFFAPAISSVFPCAAATYQEQRDLALQLPVGLPSWRGFSATAEPAYSESVPQTKQGWGGTKVFEVLRTKPEDLGAWLWCSKDDLVIDAVRKMAKGNVGSLLVFDPSKIQSDTEPVKTAASEAVVGIITERDYLTKVVVLGKNSSQLNVSEIMTPESKLKTVSPDNSVLDVMIMMIKYNFRHVPVVHEEGYLGMISIRDVVSIMLQEHQTEVRGLHEYIQGSY